MTRTTAIGVVRAFRVVDADQVPDDIRACLETGAEQLHQLGFAASHWIKTSSMEVSEVRRRRHGLGAGTRDQRAPFCAPAATAAPPLRRRHVSSSKAGSGIAGLHMSASRLT